jgi:RNA polymerase sigma-70 factor (ECF subfamily)
VLAEAPATLPPRCRDVAVLRTLRGLPQKQVAAALGIAERTVDEQPERSVARCEAYLRKHGVARAPA